MYSLGVDLNLSLDKSNIEEHPSGHSTDYNGCIQITWFAGYVGKPTFP